MSNIFTRKIEKNYETILYHYIEDVKTDLYKTYEDFIYDIDVHSDAGQYEVKYKNNTSGQPYDILNDKMSNVVLTKFKDIKNIHFKDDLISRTNLICSHILDTFSKKETELIRKKTIEGSIQALNIAINTSIHGGENYDSIKNKIDKLIDDASIAEQDKDILKKEFILKAKRGYAFFLSRNNPKKILNGEFNEIKDLNPEDYNAFKIQAEANIEGAKKKYDKTILSFIKDLEETGRYDSRIEKNIRESEFFSDEYETLIEQSSKVYKLKKKILTVPTLPLSDEDLNKIDIKNREKIQQYNKYITNLRTNDPKKLLNEYIFQMDLAPPTSSEESVELQKKLGCSKPRLTSNDECDTLVEYLYGANKEGKLAAEAACIIEQKGFDYFREINKSKLLNNKDYNIIKLSLSFYTQTSDIRNTETVLKELNRAIDSKKTTDEKISLTDKKKIKKRIESETKSFFDQYSLYTDGGLDQDSETMREALYVYTAYNKVAYNMSSKDAVKKSKKDLIDNYYNKYGGYFYPKNFLTASGELKELDPKKLYNSLVSKKKDIINVIRNEYKKNSNDQTEFFDFIWEQAEQRLTVDFHVDGHKCFFTYYFLDKKKQNVVQQDESIFYLDIDNL